MLGIVLIYFIGKHFHTLATKHQRTPWLFAVLGVVSYYVGTIIIGVFLALFPELTGVDIVDDSDTLLISLMAIPAGILSSFIFYKFLESKWSKVPIVPSSDILDDDFLSEK